METSRPDCSIETSTELSTRPERSIAAKKEAAKAWRSRPALPSSSLPSVSPSIEPERDVTPEPKATSAKVKAKQRDAVGRDSSSQLIHFGRP